jgi:hypothetical protein
LLSNKKGAMTMLQFFKILALLVGMLPDLIKLMGIVQDALGPGTGASKLEIVKSTIQTAYDVAKPVEVGFEEFWLKVASLAGTIKSNMGAKLTGG